MIESGVFVPVNKGTKLYVEQVVSAAWDELVEEASVEYQLPSFVGGGDDWVMIFEDRDHVAFFCGVLLGLATKASQVITAIEGAM